MGGHSDRPKRGLIFNDMLHSDIRSRRCSLRTRIIKVKPLVFIFEYAA